MNKGLRWTTLIVATLLLGCSTNQNGDANSTTTAAPPANEDASGGQTDHGNTHASPGPITDFVSFHASSVDAWENDFVLDRCTIGGQEAQIVIAEVTTSGTKREKECSAQITPTYVEFEMTLIKSIVGSVPQTFLMPAGLADVQIGRLHQGMRLLLSMREWRGMYVPIHSVEVSFEPDGATAQSESSAQSVDLPSEVASLVTTIQDAQSDPACDSAQRSILLERDDAFFEEAIAADRICDDTETTPVGTCETDADCNDPNLSCLDGACELNCDPQAAPDAGDACETIDHGG